MSNININKKDLLNKLAKLEFINDQLESELTDIDGLLKMIGFTDGLETVKNTAKDIVEFGWDPVKEY